MPTVSLVLAGTAAATSAVGVAESSVAQGSEAHYQAEVAQNNAIIEKQNANYAEEAGAATAQAAGLKSAEQLGAIKAAFGANNVDVNAGSAATVETSQREIGSLSQLTATQQALLQAYGYQTEATGFEAQAGLESTEAAQAGVAGVLGTAGSLLSNASSISTKWPGAGDTGSISATPNSQYLEGLSAGGT